MITLLQPSCRIRSSKGIPGNQVGNKEPGLLETPTLSELLLPVLRGLALFELFFELFDLIFELVYVLHYRMAVALVVRVA
jgi:hypothetical protein